jgi:hypothetical protein
VIDPGNHRLLELAIVEEEGDGSGATGCWWKEPSQLAALDEMM